MNSKFNIFQRFPEFVIFGSQQSKSEIISRVYYGLVETENVSFVYNEICQDQIIVVLQSRITTNYIHKQYFTEQTLPDWLKDVDMRVVHAIKFGKACGFILSGDPVVVVTGWKRGSGYTNTFRIVYVPEADDFCPMTI